MLFQLFKDFCGAFAHFLDEKTLCLAVAAEQVFGIASKLLVL